MYLVSLDHELFSAIFLPSQYPPHASVVLQGGVTSSVTPNHTEIIAESTMSKKFCPLVAGVIRIAFGL